MTKSTSGKLSVEKWARNKKLKDKYIGTVRVQFCKVAVKQSEHHRGWSLNHQNIVRYGF